MDTVFQVYFFDTAGDPDVVERIREQDTDTGKGKKLRCHSCENIVTDESQRISVENSHSHNRTNPSGIEYHFQCFGHAPGCSTIGTPTGEFTWFTGHKWQIAACNGCGEHLGWYFRGKSSFYGLITSRLISDSDKL